MDDSLARSSRDDGSAAEDPASMEWVDGRGKRWQVSLTAEQIVLRSGEEVFELPAKTWPRDVYIALHGEGYIVRFETFNQSLGFVLSREQAGGFVEHVHPPPPVPSQAPSPDRDASAAVPLLWPKVSPLALWALACSSVAFVPVLGLIPASIAVMLVVLHRKRVRRSRAWSHSRALCSMAMLLLTVGLCVSALATWSLWRNETSSSALGPPSPVERAHIEAVPASTTTRVDETRSGDYPWQGEHNWGLIAAGLVIVLLSLSLHEAGHAIAAWWLGDDFARRLGRVTINPLAHIDPLGTILLPLILLLAGAGVFGWAKPVPVRREVLSRPRRDDILISLAGPGANLLQAAVFLLVWLGLGSAVNLFAASATITNFTTLDVTVPVSAAGFFLAPVLGPVFTVVKLGFLINIFLAFFNLIPIPPLDGSRVLGNLFPKTFGRLFERIQPYAFLIFLLVLYSDLFSYLVLPAFVAVVPGLLLVNLCAPF